MNRLVELGSAGQAVWLDYLHRDLIRGGELASLIENDGLRGMTSNPSIFEKAIGEGQSYDEPIKAILDRGDADANSIYEHLAIADIRAAADAFRPTYDRLQRDDGYVSLEVSPYLAMDTAATVVEARRLWAAVDRPNLMIKVPGTEPGVAAIRTLIGEGINVNVTLLFGIDAYLAVAEAHIAGLEAWRARGGELARVRGVASFFVSRIDTVIDGQIDSRLAGSTAEESAALKSLRGGVAIANAKIAYQRYLGLIQTPRWRALAQAGAKPQRLLWASTGTKDPAYSDVLYIDNLIGPDTVNTMPPKTMDAFRDHGRVAPTLTEDLQDAEETLGGAARLGLDLDKVTAGLVVDGVEKFAKAFDELLGAVQTKRAQVLGNRLNTQSINVPPALQAGVDAAVERAAKEGWTRKLWAGDASLWTGADEGKWLGWLAAGRGEAVDFTQLDTLAAEVRDGGFDHAVLLGMGGSSLGPEVLAKTFASAPGHPELLVLDSTDPGQIARIQAAIDPARTLFVVSSKSGSTLEPNILCRHFFALVEGVLGQGKAGERFLAITDPGSALNQVAREDGFRRVYAGDPAIGGRYSVLSNFGMVPAAIIGLDTRECFASAGYMVRACAASAPPAVNPGVLLGLVLGVAANAGRDKVTFIVSSEIADVGAWLEQLLAESTGKEGKGLIPIDGEAIGEPSAYGDDRVFVSIRLGDTGDSAAEEAVSALEQGGHPVVRIVVANRQALFQEFFRWEIAVAIAGAIIGINPFDQPDVEASKVKAHQITQAYEKDGVLPMSSVAARINGVTLYADETNARAIGETADDTLDGWLRGHIGRAHAGDYVALLPYLDHSDAHIAVFQKLRDRIRDRRALATAVGFGPRFQHSTGQAYKGGPNTGVFLQITARSPADIAIAGERASFGVVEAAQALGDFEVLGERGRRLLRVDLGDDIEGGLISLSAAMERALD